MHKIKTVFLGCAAGIALLATQANAGNDPFAAGGVWCATGQGWPGTMEFDGRTGKMVLTPFRSVVLKGRYSFTVKQGSKPLSGTLDMTLDSGQESHADFEIDGKGLKLVYPAQNTAETYRSVPAAEASRCVKQHADALGAATRR